MKVRAMVNLPGLPFGRYAEVDPKDPAVAAALGKGQLVEIDEPVPDVPRSHVAESRTQVDPTYQLRGGDGSDDAAAQGILR
jgi:hypothetical protein